MKVCVGVRSRSSERAAQMRLDGSSFVDVGPVDRDAAGVGDGDQGFVEDVEPDGSAADPSQPEGAVRSDAVGADGPFLELGEGPAPPW